MPLRAALALSTIMRHDRDHASCPGDPASRRRQFNHLNEGQRFMPLFLIERNFAQELNLDDAGFLQVQQINDEVGIQWLFSFLSVDKRKTYCLYEAPNEEAIRTAARRLDVPADVIVPVGTIPIAEFRAEKYAMMAPSRS